jgi:hypothetical protein
MGHIFFIAGNTLQQSDNKDLDVHFSIKQDSLHPCGFEKQMHAPMGYEHLIAEITTEPLEA